MGRVDVASKEQEGLPEKGKRVPFGGLSYKLAVANKHPDYFYCWFKDHGDMLQRAQAAWYEFVSPREARGVELTNRDVHGGNQSVQGDRYEVFGGRDEWGKGYNMVLMRQHNQYHDEDLALAEEQNMQVDAAIRRQPDKAGQYGKATISTKFEE
jgi:hypothetical protein